MKTKDKISPLSWAVILALCTFLLGLVVGFILGIIVSPPETIIIQNLPPETLPGIMQP